MDPDQGNADAPSETTNAASRSKRPFLPSTARDRILTALTAISVIAILVAFLLPVLRSSRRSGKFPCLGNLKASSVGSLMYAEDHDGRLPPGGVWMDSIASYVADRLDGDSVFRCIALRRSKGYGYAMNFELSSAIAIAPDADRQVLFFESVLTVRNACSGIYGLPNPSRHDGKNALVYLDGHSTVCRDDQPLTPGRTK